MKRNALKRNLPFLLMIALLALIAGAGLMLLLSSCTPEKSSPAPRSTPVFRMPAKGSEPECRICQ